MDGRREGQERVDPDPGRLKEGSSWKSFERVYLDEIGVGSSVPSRPQQSRGSRRLEKLNKRKRGKSQRSVYTVSTDRGKTSTFLSPYPVLDWPGSSIRRPNYHLGVRLKFRGLRSRPIVFLSSLSVRVFCTGFSPFLRRSTRRRVGV